MTDQIKSITQSTLIPIGLVITIGGSIFAFGLLFGQVYQNKEGVQECKAWQASAPTQYQFESLQGSMNEIKADVKEMKQVVDDLKLKNVK